jgi:O-succinylbenzoic acid--CoA ligase
MPCSQTFVDRLKRAWDNGDAIFPLDQRLPQPAREAVLNAIRPTRIATENYEVSYNGEPVESGDAVVVATSGTTGTPKGVVLTHSAVEASARATSEQLKVESGDKWLACLPVSHVGGLSVVLRSLVMGTPLIAAPQFSIETYNDAASDGATLVSLVSTALQRVDPTLFRTIVLGGAKPPLKRPTNTVTTYGMTETGSGVVYDGIPLSGVEVDIRDSVVYLRAPMLLRTYRDGAIPLTTDGWFRTGDIGSFINGIVSIEGREGDLIITGGENVWPDAVEEVIRTHSSVDDVCVAGLPDDEWGQRVTAWIVANEESTLSLDEIREHVKQTLPAHCAPHQIVLTTNIPRTTLGKPQRSLLVASIND